MKKFLELVAEDLYRKFGKNLTNVYVVFPNRRAELFFNECLYNAAKTTIWLPNYTTISELVQTLSNMKIADNILLVGYLYKAYKKYTRSNENFSDFYFWGELLLKDFDDVDKTLVDAKKLFANLKELKNFKNNFEFLDNEQKEALKLFFKNFSPEKQSELKQKFIEIWDVLGNIYNDFRQNITEKNIAYEGMAYRAAAENEKTVQGSEIYVFVGFNALNKCENLLFKKMQTSKKSLFYWDYDEYYIKNEIQEAGVFMRKNIEEFPQQLDAKNFDNIKSNNKKIRLISAPTETAQASYATVWTNNIIENGGKTDANSTIILNNESLLLPVLHSLPKNIENVNITMGFPLLQTPIYGTITAILNLHTKAYEENTQQFLKDQIICTLQNRYIQEISENAELLRQKISRENDYRYKSEYLQKDEILAKIFTPTNNVYELAEMLKNTITEIKEKRKTQNNLYDEAIFKAYTQINRLADVVISNDIEINKKIFAVLLKRLLSSTTTPFKGEPLKGLQIMGLLETRNIDFDNILILSANEGRLPKSEGEVSFIPFNIRKAFGLTTSDKKNAISAYYFYRLLQRSKNVTITYNTATEGINRGELSRFALQLMTETDLEFERLNIQSKMDITPVKEIEVTKTANVLEKLNQKYSAPNEFLSPSAINTFTICHLKFYFQYIAKFRVPDEQADSISLIFGRAFHKTMETIYKKIGKFKPESICGEDLDFFLKNKKVIAEIIEDIIKTEAKISDSNNFSGQMHIMQDAVVAYVLKMLKFDKTQVPFSIVANEFKIIEPRTFKTPIGEININLGGNIDRIDEKNGILRILDYKTGGSPESISNFDDMFSSKNKHSNYAFQACFYSMLMAKKTQNVKIMPEVLYVNKNFNDSKNIKIAINNQFVEEFDRIKPEFEDKLQQLISDFFDPEKPFTQTTNTDNCKYCIFLKICKRQKKY